MAEDGDVAAAARALLSAGQRFLIADLTGDDLLAVADLPEARDAMILNVRDSDDRLRAEDCRLNVYHVAPSFAQRADGLAQYLVWKRWRRWFLIAGEKPADLAYVTAIRRAAAKFGAELVEERAYTYEAGSRRIESGHQQIQTQMPLVNQAAPEHDVIFVADAAEAFGEYLLFRSEQPRPVVGSHGLVGVAWHRAFEQFGGLSLHSSFERRFGRWMRERDYTAWLAAKMFGEAVTRTGFGRPDDHSRLHPLAGLRDRRTQGDRDDLPGLGPSAAPTHPCVRPRALVSMSPQDGFLHERSELDTLGFDEPESLCRFP